MRATSFLLFFALGLTGCPGGSETPEATPAPESTPTPVVEASPEASASDDDDSAAPAASDDDDSAPAAPSAPDDAAAAATDEPAGDAATPDEPPPPPREEGVDPPYDVTLIGVARDGQSGGVFSVSVRGEPDIIKDITWTMPAGFKGPTKTAGEEDSIYAWTLSGVPKGASKGTVVAKLDTWTRTVDYELPPLEEEPPPSPPEDPAPANPAPADPAPADATPAPAAE